MLGRILISVIITALSLAVPILAAPVNGPPTAAYQINNALRNAKDAIENVNRLFDKIENTDDKYIIIELFKRARALPTELEIFELNIEKAGDLSQIDALRITNAAGAFGESVVRYIDNWAGIKRWMKKVGKHRKVSHLMETYRDVAEEFALTMKKKLPKGSVIGLRKLWEKVDDKLKETIAKYHGFNRKDMDLDEEDEDDECSEKCKSKTGYHYLS